jgi:hypothetical protein
MTRPSWNDYATGDESESADLLRGIVAHWVPALGPSGLRLHDVSGRNNWGTLTGMDAATDWIISPDQYALDFDGVNDYVLVTRSRFFDVLTGDKTVQAWVKTSSPGASFRTVVSRDKTFSITLQNSIFGTYDWSASTFRSSGVNVADGTWKHLAVSIRAGITSGSQCFINGVPQGSAFTYNTQTGNTTNDITIGTALSAVNAVVNEYVNGQFDDIAVWSRAMTASEIQAVYNLGRGGMLRRRRQRRAYIPEAAFRAYWARQRAQLIGGGV